MTDVDAGGPPERRGCVLPALGGIAFVAVLAAIGGLGARLWDAFVVAPWAWPPGPVLTDGWVGTSTSPTGRPLVLHLDLGRAHNGQGFLTEQRRAVVEGTGAWCAGGTPRTAVELAPIGSAGRAADDLRVNPVVVEPPADGLLPGSATGRFTGATVELVVELRVLRGGVAESGPAQPDSLTPVTFTLTRGDRAAFDAACAPPG